MDKRILLFVPTLLAIIFVVILFGCTGNRTYENPISMVVNTEVVNTAVVAIDTLVSTSTPTPFYTPTTFIAATHDPDSPILSPTPDSPRVTPTPGTEPPTYMIQDGDTLANIAALFAVPWTQVAQENGISNPNMLIVGEVLTIPTAYPDSIGTSFKIIPDSELVYGPTSATFDLDGFIQSYDGYLADYWDDINGVKMTGTEIIQEIANLYSVNPRLLLAVIEYQSGWVTQMAPENVGTDYCLGYEDAAYPGLYYQLMYIANELNRGYYTWKASSVNSWIDIDGDVIPISKSINPGTAAVQQAMAKLYGLDDWKIAVSEDGFYQTYEELFGYPFDLTFDPIIPDGLTQPAMQLPFEEGEYWSFTGGPHAGWAAGSAWAALDFAPPGEAIGCQTSPYWSVAVADGWIVRAYNGAVVEELDGDGYEQTGWTILYAHTATTDDRVQVGQYVQAGDRIGHPSCEGGYANGSHLHLARRYNGEWIAADGDIPFNLDSCISSGTGIEYDGDLTCNDETYTAYDGKAPFNQIKR